MTSAVSPHENDERDQLWLDDRISAIDNGLQAVLDIAENWTDGRNVARLLPRKMSAAEYVRTRISAPLGRDAVATLLAETNWSNRQIATVAGVSEGFVRKELRTDTQLNRPVQTLGADGVLRPAQIVRTVTAEVLEPAWETVAPEPLSESDQAILDLVRSGQTVVVSFRWSGGLVDALKAEGLFVRIDRQSDWGNPFEMPSDGDRATVIRNYRTHYLPYKPSLLARLEELRGKALGCWCAPEPCHGDVLVEALS